MANEEHVIQLHKQGKSVRSIAEELKISKSSVHRIIQKSLSNPTWTVVGGPRDQAPVDLYGAIPAPTAEDLMRMNQEVVYACVKFLADAVAGTPLKVYVVTRPGQKQPKCRTARVHHKNTEHLGDVDLKEVLEHPLKDILDHPNPEMPKCEFLRLIDSDISLAGNAFCEIKRAEDDLPEEVWMLPPQYVELARDDYNRVLGFWDKRLATKRFVPRKNMLWIKLSNPSEPYGLGYGPVQGVYQRILLSMAELGYLSGLFRNQARPDSIIKVKDILADEAERMQKELNMRFRQGGMGGVWVVDSEELDVKNLNWAPKDVMSTEIYKWSKQQILNAFGLNESVFMTESSNRAVADAGLYMAAKHAILPRCRLIEETINHQLSAEFDDRLIVSFDDPVPENDEFKLQEQTALLDRSVLTINEVRMQRGLDPVAWGEEPINQGGQNTETNNANKQNDGEEDK